MPGQLGLLSTEGAGMLTREDIDAFEAEHSRDIEAAKTYTRRAKKGLPSDRWADGADGCLRVARGIDAQSRLLDVFARTTAEMAQIIKEIGEQSMGLGPERPDKGE